MADITDYRVLFCHTPPAAGIFHPADAMIGQPDLAANGEDRWKKVERDTLCWPYGIHWHRGQLAIADSGNN